MNSPLQEIYGCWRERPLEKCKDFVSQQKGNFQVESRYCYIVTSAIANTVCSGGGGDEKETSMY